METELRDEYPELRYAWEKYEHDLVAIRDDCQARGIPLVVYAIPSKAIAKDSRWTASTRHDPDAYERGKSFRRTADLCRRAGIPYVDIASAIMKAQETENLYFERDGHLDAHGVKFVAERLAEFLVDEQGTLREFVEE